MTPGEIVTVQGEITLNAGRATKTIEVANSGDRPIQVGSHYHFFEVNRALRFARAEAYGFRLDIPAGTSVRFEPGEARAVPLVALGGRRIIHGLRGLVSGGLDDPTVRARALEDVDGH
jgi:urease beta subunit